MKNRLFFLILSTCMIFFLINCSHITNSNPQKEKAMLATIGNDCFAMNLSSSYVMWLAGSCGGEMSGLPIYNGDLLYISLIGGNDIPFLIQHNIKDGTPAYYSYGKTHNREYLYSLNNSIIQINFENKPEVWEWLENTTTKEIKNIQTLSFSRNNEPSYFPMLEKIAKVNNHPGIIVTNPWQLRNILPLFQPDWLFIEQWEFSPNKETLEEELFELLKKQGNLKTFCYMSETRESVPHYKMLSSLTSLRNLILSTSAFNKATQPILPESLINLEEILIFSRDNEKIDTLSSLKEMTNLEKLRIIGATLSENLEEISTIPRLTTLSFVASKVENFQSIIKMIPSLLWFSFPKNISQEDFESFITYNPQLEYCEFFSCKDIIDLSPLVNLKNLNGLILIDMEIDDYSPLYSLKDLDFLVLPEKFFKKDYDTERAELQKELPNSHLVCGTPFCLGSGWIIIIPLIILLCPGIIVCFKKFITFTKKGFNH